MVTLGSDMILLLSFVFYVNIIYETFVIVIYCMAGNF